MTRSQENQDFKINDLVFAKVRGYPFWPAKITNINQEKHKNSRFEVVFYTTNETAWINKTDICRYLENKIKYSLDSVANKHKKTYQNSLNEIEKAWESSQSINTPSRTIVQKTPLNSNKSAIKKSKAVTSSLSQQKSIGLSKIKTSKSVQTESVYELNDKGENKDNSEQSSLNKRSLMSLSLLKNEWVTDDTILMYYDTLANSVLKPDENVFLMNAVVTQAIKCLQDIDDVISPLELSKRTYIFFPINDAQLTINKDDPNDIQNQYKKGGSHWSLLVFAKSLNKFLYFDSCRTYNLVHAQQTAKKVSKFLETETEIPLVTVTVPQQHNTVDCGVYLTVFTDLLIHMIRNDKLGVLEAEGGKLPCTIKQANIVTKRAQLAYLWHSYPLLKTEVVSDMMFSLDEPYLYQSNQVSKDSKEKNSPSGTVHKTWKTPKNTGKKKYIRNEDFNITLTNKFDLLSITNQEDKTSEAQKPLNDKIKMNLRKSSHTKKINNHKKSQVKVNLFADSQGKSLPEIVGECSEGRVSMDGLVKSGAGIQHVYNQAMKSHHHPLVIIAGTNNILKRSPQIIYSEMENKLRSLSSSRQVCITTIPPRFDLQPNSDVHYEIALGNNYIRELVLRLNNVSLIDFDNFQRYHFTRHGMHLSYKGKRKLAHLIIEFVEDFVSKKHQKNLSPFSHFLTAKKQKIKVVETHMAHVINQYRNDSEVGFAHSISGDFDDPRHMTAGVAVVFKQQFGKPVASQCLTKHLALQNDGNGASVYSLITKDQYFGKPEKEDYEEAFCDLTKDFKQRGLKHLICSPVGCARDNVGLEQFAMNILKFQQHTNASVTVVSYYQKSFRRLYNGLSHDEFLRRIKQTLDDQQKHYSESSNNEPLFSKDHGVAKMEESSSQMSTLQVITPEKVQPPSQTSPDCERVEIVSGALTFSEALKQRNGVESMSEIVNHVGCDGVVGSDQRYDSCGVCGGDNSTCRVISGLFTRPQLPVGYNLITQIPQAACNLSITELKRSRNYLALRKVDGTFILNGNWAINWSGEFDALGTKFSYHREDEDIAETITSPGPLAEPLDLMVIYQQPNPGIKYQYQLPVEKPDNSITVYKTKDSPLAPQLRQADSPSPPKEKGKEKNVETRFNGKLFPYGNNVLGSELQGYSGDEAPKPKPKGKKRKFAWKITGFSECSKSCGGGVQTAVVVCVREHNQLTVPDKRCASLDKPSPQVTRCNLKPCVAEWVGGEWSECSVSCGEGVQTREILCRQQITPTLTMTVAEGACLTPPSPLLTRSRPCQRPPCGGAGALNGVTGGQWTVGAWSQCSAKCGQGVQTRSVLCPTGDCNVNERPATESSCTLQACQSHRHSHVWLYTEWTQECSESCGTGVQKRRIVCSAGPKMENLCDSSLRPDHQRACSSDKQCEALWFTGPWSPCTASCGWGQQTRSIICVSRPQGGDQMLPTADEKCRIGDKPAAEQQCKLQPCGPEWYMGEWSQCSRSCDTGVQRRDVRCLDETQQVAMGCSDTSKPPSRRSCNTHKCPSLENKKKDSTALTNDSLRDQPQLQNLTKSEDADCKDRFRNCHLVVQARLCKYKYYRSSCCKACQQHKL